MHVIDTTTAKSTDFINMAGFGADIRYDAVSDFLNLAKCIVRKTPSDALLLSVDEWGVWPSSENWYLFDTLCLTLFGEKHRMKTMSFGPDDQDAAITFLQLSMQFGWGGVFFADEKRWFRFSHDGYAFMSTEEDVSDIFQITGVFDLSTFDR